MAADALGTLLMSPRLLFRRQAPIDPSGVREILVIRTAYIGDAVMTLPVLRPLKERYPGARITFLTSRAAQEVIEGNPYVDEIMTYNPFWFYSSEPKGAYLDFIGRLRQRRFDLVIEARADIREILFLAAPARARYKVSYDVGGGGYMLSHIVPYERLKHKVEYHLDIARYLGCNVEKPDWGVYLRPDEKERVSAMLGSIGITDGFIAVHPGTRLKLKRWLNDRYASLYDKIMAEFGLPLLVLGMAEEKDLINSIVNQMRRKPVVLTGETSLRELAAIVDRAAMFVCNDSAPMHIATAMGTPVAAFFGPSKSVETGPYGQNCRTIEVDIPCRPACDENTCLNRRYHACMEDITVEHAFAVIKELYVQGARV